MGKSKKNRNKQQAAPAPAPTPARKLPIVPITIGVVVVLIAIVVVVSSQAQSVNFVDGKTSRTIATVDECAFTTLAISIPEGMSPEDAAQGIFDALSRTTGVGLVTIYEDDPRVEIDYCASYTSEPVLRDILVQAGYATP